MTSVKAARSLIEDAWKDEKKWQSNYSHAQKILESLLIGDPENITLLTCLGAVLSDQGFHQKAAVLLEQAVLLGSADRNTYFNLAVSTINNGTHEVAMQFFTQAKSLNPSPDTWGAYFDPQAH
jgi:Flp pilus assembly protein TadD